MGKKVLIISFSLILILIASAHSNAYPVFQKISQEEFYSAISSDDTVKINSQLGLFQHSTGVISQAYTGALLMKKSSHEKGAGKKLELFKEGKNLLEQAIKTENQNAEFRFLRLMIQENCPAILNYHDSKKEDAEIVKDYYKNFSPALKQAVTSYSKISETLKPGDFRN